MSQILLTYAHINLCWQISRAMLLATCGHLYPNFTAWTPLAWLPGCAVTLWLGQAAGWVLMFGVSVIAGRMMRDLLARNRDEISSFETLVRDWRTWVTGALWLMWVPVPAVYAFVYQFAAWATGMG